MVASFIFIFMVLAPFVVAVLLAYRAEFRLWRDLRNWDWIFLAALAVCLALALGITCVGAMPDHKKDWLFVAIDAVFSVLEGDSEAFRGYAAFCHPAGVILSVTVPLLTVSTVLMLLWNRLPHPVPMGHKVWYVFAELEPHSIHLANSIKDKKGIFIFLRCPRGKVQPELLAELKGINYHLYPKTESAFLRYPWRRWKTLRFFFLSENTDENFQRMDRFLDDVKDKHLFFQIKKEYPEGSFRQELYLLSETESAPMLIGHLREKLAENKKRLPVFEHTELRLLDRNRAISYALLRKEPLYRYHKDGRTNVLVLGFGRIGREFFRAAYSVGIMPNRDVHFTLRDLRMVHRWRAFCQQCPELATAANVEIKNLNAESTALEKLVSTKEFHYIVVALGDDERNIKAASWLKRYYRIRHWQDASMYQPLICVNIEDEIKSAYTKKLWEATADWDSALCVFGTVSEIFSAKTLMPEDLWRAAQWIHRELTKKSSQERKEWTEYERRSSIACAAHAEYHVASVQGDYQDALHHMDKTEKDAMIESEHRRWMAYVRSEGMQRSTFDMVKAYYHALGNHVDVRARLTPCLIEGEAALRALFEEIKKLHGDDFPEDVISFWDRDKIVVENADTICSQ